MWLKNIQIKNIKGFIDSGVIEFSKRINVVAGPNNAGKTTILKSVQTLQPLGQSVGDFLTTNRRIGSNGETFGITLNLEEPGSNLLNGAAQPSPKDWKPRVEFTGQPTGGITQHLYRANGILSGVNGAVCPVIEPENFIYPYSSRRKPAAFQLQINENNAKVIEEMFQNLPSKIDRLVNPDSPWFDLFRKTCSDILGFKISCAQYGAGKQAGLILQNNSLLPIDKMGEGVLHILGLLVHLCPADGKLFLIEEIENDLHPKSLKRLLEFIIEKSSTNQFIISTHNNIVVRALGGAPEGKVFYVEMKLDESSRVPVSICTQIGPEPEKRIAVLENLGYDIFDSFLWKGYFILEESSAERIIRDFLIPHFFPSLVTRLKTIASSGVQDVEPRLTDFLRLFVFVHTTPVYKQRAWVAVDGSADGRKIIADLKLKFNKDWPESHFRCFSEENFEKYYPKRFEQQASAVLAMPHGLLKQKAKGALAEEVVGWALANSEEAKKEFAVCAKEILEILAVIKDTLISL